LPVQFNISGKPFGKEKNMKKYLLVVIFIIPLALAFAETLISGTISSSATWNLAGSPYIINGSVSIYGTAQPVITIEAGVTIKFNSGAALNIGHTSTVTYKGGLIVNGTELNPVLFTANSDTPSPGYWNYLRCNQYMLVDNVIFNHASFEYGGSTSGLIDVNGGNPKFYNCSFRYSANYGLYHTSTSSAFIQDCSFQDNNGYPLYWNPDMLSGIGNGNSFTGNNPDRILLKEMVIAQNATVPNKGISYEAAGNLTVRGSEGPVLTVENGAQLMFRPGKTMYLGSTTSTAVTGGLSAQGAIFTAVDPDVGWNGLDFQTYTTNSSLVGCTISGVNSTPTAAVYIRCNNPLTILNCTFTQNTNYALNCSSGASFTVTGCVFSNNNRPINMFFADAHKLGSGNSYLNNFTQSIRCQGGTVNSDIALIRQPVPLNITSNVNLYDSSNPLLTIPYGSVLEFSSGISMVIGSTSSSVLQGRINATGVTFRGGEAALGYWTGLILNTFADYSVLSGCIIKDAGYNSSAALNVNCPTANITGCTIYNNAAKGIYVNPGRLPQISGNVIFGCGSYPLSIGANSLRVLGQNNYFSGNSFDMIELRAETVNTSGTWRNAGVPYFVTGSFSIYDTASPHIKILSGTIIKLPNLVGITVGSSSSSVLRGSLEATGVTFTRSAAGEVPLGIIFNPYLNEGLSVLTNCTFEFLQHNSQYCAVYVNNSAPRFESCTFSNNPSHGIVATSAARPLVNNSSFVNNGGYPIKTNAAAFDVVSGVGNYFSGNNPDRILISGASLNASYTWDNPSVPIEITGDISIYGSSGPILKINSGLVLLFHNGYGFAVGSSSSPSLTGGLQAEGATFGSLSDTMGTFNGIRFNLYQAAGSYLRNCVIRNGGINGNIWVNNAALSYIESCVVRDGNIGIKLNGTNAQTAIIRNHILSNDVGIYLSFSANPLIGGALGDGNAIVGNTSYGVQNTASNTINAEYNWWGDEQGPTVRFGDSVTGNVDYTPWRTTNIGDAPSRFHLSSPASASIVESLTPVLDWEEAIDPSPGDIVQYHLELALNSSFSSGLIDYPGLNSTVFHVPSGVLSDDTRYYWKVSATDTQGQTTTSYENYLYFNVAVPEYPSAFNTLIPTQDETVLLTSPLLSWQASLDPDPGDVVSYTVYRDVSADFAAPDSLQTTATQIYSEFCQPGTLYYWKVKATDSTGQSTESPYNRFWVSWDAIPRAPVEVAAQILANDIIVFWDSVPGADNYYIYHSLLPDSGFTLLGSSSSPNYLHIGAANEARGFYKIVAEDTIRRR
jgi:parallel beta-helix repeat protein